MKKTSIRKKIYSLTVRTALISLIVIGVITIGGIWILRYHTGKISGDLGEMAAADSQKALEEQMTDRLVTLAENKAALSDSSLLNIQNSVEMIAQGAEEIVQHPKRFIPNPAKPPNVSNGGMMTVQFLKAQNINMEAIKEESAIMGNIQGLLLNIIQNNVNATSNYIGSEKGYIIIADEAADKKTEFFDPREREWYKLAAKNNSLSWSDVFVDAYGRGLGITCAKPYYDEEGRIAGVAGVGTILNELTEIVIRTRVGETGYAFILNELGQIIIPDESEADEYGSILREDLLNSGNAELAAATQNMIDRKNGIERVNIDGKEHFIAYAALETLPWSLAIIIPVDEAIAPSIESREHIIDMKNDALGNIDLIIMTVLILFIVAIALIILFINYFSKRFANTLTKPIISLQDGVREIADGNLNLKLNIHTGDEIEGLGLSVNKMAVDIKDYITHLQTVTIEKERIGAELDVATKIQASMLPCIFPPFPDRAEFDIYASMEPAKEVGGDFYDFFLIDDNTLAVVIADVSGKGVPAALFMVITKTLIKNNAQLGKSPKEVFEAVNNQLCENNEAVMFVTAVLGYLDIPTGKFAFVNAGHNPPLLCVDGQLNWLKAKAGFVLAGMEDMIYQQHEILLQRGDKLFLYTDGVTEAMNKENKLFSDLRLFEAASNNCDLPPHEFCRSIKHEVNKFAEGQEQADDITMLALRYWGEYYE